MIAALPLVTSALPIVDTALSAASSASAAAQAGAAAQTASVSGSGQDFGQMLAQMSSDTVGSLKSAESMSIDGIKGSANVQAVVQSVMAAQESLQTALAVRDKTVAAFQEVTRMSI